jgi:four helix bundle protein
VGSAKTFEQLDVWKGARELMRLVYAVSSSSDFAGDVGLKDQIRRASVSVMANIAEGFERGGDKEFLQFLAQAKGSCGELRSHLAAALDLTYIGPDLHADIEKRAVQASRMLASLMNYLRSSKLRGSKFHRTILRP